MPQMELGPMVPVFMRSKTLCALDHGATVTSFIRLKINIQMFKILPYLKVK
jgi:hypothetical protein